MFEKIKILFNDKEKKNRLKTIILIFVVVFMLVNTAIIYLRGQRQTDEEVITQGSETIETSITNEEIATGPEEATDTTEFRFKDSEIEQGVFQNGHYENEELGIEIDVPNSWRELTPEEKEYLLPKNRGENYDLFICNEKRGSSIGIVLFPTRLEDIEKSKDILDKVEFNRKMAESIAETFERLEDEISYEDVFIGDHLYSKSVIQGNSEGRSGVICFLNRMVKNEILQIHIGANDLNELNKILNYFK